MFIAMPFVLGKKMDEAPMSINRRSDIQTVVYSPNGLILPCKNNRTIDQAITWLFPPQQDVQQMMPIKKYF